MNEIHKTMGARKELRMEERKYLKWYNKVGYGSGDLAANCIYGLLTSFVMIYLTDTVGLNAGIIGTLIMFSKFADGITDVFFGNLIDKTKSKMGKARPWMLYAQIGNCICLVAVFAIPSSLGKTAQYAYFFIAYTLLNAVFYTANNIAYASLTSLITKNGNERVQMGSIRFMFSLATNIIVQSITVGLVTNFGGGAKGWRTVAFIYAIIAFIVNAISVFSVKELPPEEKDFFPGIYEAFAFQQIFPDDRSVLYSDLCADRYRRNRYLLYDICLGKSGIAWYVLNGTDAPDGDWSCIYTGIGEKVQRNV